MSKWQNHLIDIISKSATMQNETRVGRAERVISEANNYIQVNKVQAERKANAEFWKQMNEIPNATWDWSCLSKPVVNITIADIDAAWEEELDRPMPPKRKDVEPKFNDTYVCRNLRIGQFSRHLAAYRIQQWWHRIRLDPYHPVGKRRLEREYTELFGVDESP